MELTIHVNDKIKLYTKTFLASHHRHVLHLLYQPLIGEKASSVYETLWSLVEIEKNQLVLSHRQLLTFFDVDLKTLIEVRERLEAINLLNVFYHSKEGYYLYELKAPLSAKQFFKDSNLNINLMYTVGDALYDYLESKFINPSIDPQLLNITKNFEDVYPFLNDVRNTFDDTEYVTSAVNHFKVPIAYNFDFELFSVLLSKSFVPKEQLNDELKEAIIKVAALYRFDEQMMSQIAIESAKDQVLDVNRLHEVAKMYYKKLGTKHKKTRTVKAKMSVEEYEKNTPPPQTVKERALKMYKTKTPHEWLRALLNDTEVPSSHLEVIRVLYDDYKLPEVVINVLLELIIIRTDGRLPMEYAKTIASSWVYKKINTAESAIAEVEKIKNAEMEYTKKGQVAPTYVRKPKRVVDNPDWLKEHQDYRKQTKVEEEDVDILELQKLLSTFK